jgi:DNA helicase-2/ATP-dependent DNA helicase PcrA
MSSTSSSLSPSRRPPLDLGYLNDLNDEQRQAVLAPSGPLIVLAGAGTGKTRVITARIAYLIHEKGLAPQDILALTFSKKAAEEMAQRVEKLLGIPSDALEVFTFHGFCHRFLEEHGVKLGLATPLRLLDRADPKRRAQEEEVAYVYRLYQERMRACGYMDFEDLIVETVLALKEHPVWLEALRRRYRAILVDEFQDTNVAQIELLKLLADDGKGLCVVGDDDQAIYRFRGASFASFILLKQAYPNVQTIRLIRNYRSSCVILSVADRLIRHNEPDRYDPNKVLQANQPNGLPVEVWFCRDDGDEAERVIEIIEKILAGRSQGDRRLSEMAILYRAHAYRKPIVEALMRAGIPFSVRGGMDLMEQPCIRKLLDLLRILHDPNGWASWIGWFRLLSDPSWGIPPETLMAIYRFARDRERTVEQVWNESDLGVGEEVRLWLGKRVEEMESLRRQALSSDLLDLMDRVVDSEFLRLTFREPPSPLGDPLACLGQFLRLTHRYIENHPDGNHLAPFLEYLDSLEKSGIDPATFEETDQPGDRIRLMSVHQAKGLEFDWVILLSLTRDRFPTRYRSEAIPFPDALMKEPLPKGDFHRQEERRLCYVACTRARKGLFLLTRDRLRFKPSIFVEEMMEGASSEEMVQYHPEQGSADTSSLSSLSSQGLFDGEDKAADRRVLEIFSEIRRMDPNDEDGFARCLNTLYALANSIRGKAKVKVQGTAEVVPSLPEKVSHTQLGTYRTCPRQYLYAYGYRIPKRPTPQKALGEDIHKCLEWCLKEVIAGRVPSLEEILHFFRRLHRPGRYGEPGQDEGYRALGQRMLETFYRKQEEAGRWPVPLHVEKSVTFSIGDVWIQGVIDRIDPLEDGGVEIVDYKTGKPKTEVEFEDEIQLWLYAIAAQETLGLTPRRMRFHYLQDASSLVLNASSDGMERARAWVTETVQSIRAGDFHPTPEWRKCQQCDYRTLCPASRA